AQRAGPTSTIFFLQLVLRLGDKEAMAANEFASRFREVEAFSSTRRAEATLSDLALSVASQLSPAMKFMLPCAPFADGARTFERARSKVRAPSANGAQGSMNFIAGESWLATDRAKSESVA